MNFEKGKHFHNKLSTSLLKHYLSEESFEEQKIKTNKLPWERNVGPYLGYPIQQVKINYNWINFVPKKNKGKHQKDLLEKSLEGDKVSNKLSAKFSSDFKKHSKRLSDQIHTVKHKSKKSNSKNEKSKSIENSNMKFKHLRYDYFPSIKSSKHQENHELGKNTKDYYTNGSFYAGILPKFLLWNSISSR